MAWYMLKPLSRKFNNCFLNRAGLLARVPVATFPPPWDSGIEVAMGIHPRADKAYSCGNSFGVTPNSLLIPKKNALGQPVFGCEDSKSPG